MAAETDWQTKRAALCRPDAGDVRPPLPVRAMRRKVLRGQVGRDRRGIFTIRRALKAPLLPCD